MYKISVVFLFVLCACSNANEPNTSASRDKEILQAGRLEQVALTDLNDVPIDMEKYKGKTVFINFWATWCKPCREEMPSIQAAMNILKDEEVEFLFASDESTEQIAGFRDANPYNFRYVKVENLAGLNILGLPTTFIFNPDGDLIFSEMGYRKWDDQANIDLLLHKSGTK